MGKPKNSGGEASFNGGLIPEIAGERPAAPQPPAAPEVALGPKSAVATYPAPGQKVTRVKLQAVPSKKFKTGAAAFKKFKVGKNGCIEGLTNLKADESTRCVLQNVDPASGYFFRLVLVNAVGQTESPPTDNIPAANAPKTAKELKAEAKAKAAREKEEAKAAKAAVAAKAKEEVAAAKAAKKKPSLTRAASSSASVATEEAKPEPVKVDAKPVESSSGKVSGGLGGAQEDYKARAAKLVSRLEKEEQRRESQPNMFRKNAEEEKRSKIFNALNPQSLAYVSAREKAEMEQESTQLQVRGGFGGFNRDGGMGPDFAKMRDDEGNIIDPSESEEEEEDVGYADGNVPDFGEFQGVLDEARQRRAKEEAEHKAKLREAWEKKKADEEAERQKLLKQYAEEEAARKKKEEMSQSDVQKAQQRVARDSVRHLKDFSWN